MKKKFKLPKEFEPKEEIYSEYIGENVKVTKSKKLKKLEFIDGQLMAVYDDITRVEIEPHEK